MTLSEAQYVLAHRHDYDDRTYHYALDIVEAHVRQCRDEGCSHGR